MTQKYKQNFLRAGKIAKEVRSFGKSLIKTGASYNDVIASIYQKIEALGAKPAFPPQIALDDVAAHFLPQPMDDIIFSREVVKLDVGICYEGAIGDCALTVDLSGSYQELVDAAEAALLAAEQSIHVGLPIRKIGKIIEDTIASYGFVSVKNLSGHGLGYYKIHTPPAIPNYENRSSALIKPGMTFAIEPFATDGRGLIEEVGEATIFSLVADCKPPSEKARALLEKIKTFSGLPFSIHNLLSQDFALQEVRALLASFVDSGAIIGYPPLVEEAGGMVAQAENSVLVDEEGKVFITTR